MFRINKLVLAVVLLWSCFPATAQDPKPLTSQEVVSLLYQLQRNPDMRDEIVEVESPETGTPLPDSYQAAPPLE